MRRPTIGAGARVALIAPGGPLKGEDDLQRAEGNARALHGEDSCGAAITASMLHPGRARGRLVGGNLALLSALAGTPYEPNYHDAILIVEDVNEAAYRIDRMLTQLRLAGRLAQCRGIVFGQFTDIPTAASDGSTRTLDDVLREVVSALEVPSIAGAPIGHVADQWTVPLGAIAERDAESRTLRILDW